MNADQFCEAMVGLYDRAARLPDCVGGRIRGSIETAIREPMPEVDERLARLHRQLTLIEITHRLTRVECQAMMTVG